MFDITNDHIRFTKSEKLLNWRFRFYSMIITITAYELFTTEKI